MIGMWDPPNNSTEQRGGLSMYRVLFSSLLPDGKQMYVAPVSIDAFEANEAHALGDDTGYFIYESDARGPADCIEILGKATSYETAVRLADIFLSVQHPTDSAGRLCVSPEPNPSLRSEPDADWYAISVAMHELGRTLTPLFELSDPPAWAVALKFAMDAGADFLCANGWSCIAPESVEVIPAPEAGQTWGGGTGMMRAVLALGPDTDRNLPGTPCVYFREGTTYGIAMIYDTEWADWARATGARPV